MRDSTIWAMVARFATVALFFDGITPLFPAISHSFSVHPNDFQKIIGLAFIAFALFQLLSLYAIAYWGLYRCILFSSLAIVIAVVLICVLEQALYLAIVFILMFAFNSVGSNATRIALRELTSHTEFKRYFAWANTIVQIKQMLLPALVGVMALSYGWRSILFVLMLPIALASLWLSHIDKTLTVSPPQVSLKLSSLKNLFKEKSFVNAILILSLFHACFAYTSAWFAFVLVEEMGLSTAKVGLLLSLGSGLMAIGFLLSEHLSKRIPSGQDGNTLLIGLACMLSAAMFMFLPADALRIAGFLILDFSYAFFILPCTAIVMNTTPSDRPLASAILGFIQPVSGGACVLLMGLLALSPLLAIPFLILMITGPMLVLRRAL